jgi:hypothetical protein
MLRAKVKVEEQKNSMLVYDCTGRYSPDNTGGYFGPNPTKERAYKATLEVCVPDSSEYGSPIDLSANLPNKEDVPVEIYPYQIGQIGPFLTSGKYKFKYTVTASVPGGLDVTTTAFYTTVFTNEVECCVDKASSTIDVGNLKGKKEQDKIEISNILENVMSLICSGDYDKADKNIQYIKSYCSCPNCR